MARGLEKRTVVVTQPSSHKLCILLFSPSSSLSHHLGFSDLWMQQNAAKTFLSLSHMPGNVFCTFMYLTSFFPWINPSRYSYQTKLRSICPKHSKVNLPTRGCDEGKDSICCKTPSKEYGQLMLKKTRLSLGFQGRAFKGKGRKRVVGCMISLCTVLWLVSGKVTGSTFKNLKHQPSGSNCSGIYALVVSEQLTSAWWGFSICKTTQEYGSG